MFKTIVTAALAACLLFSAGLAIAKDKDADRPVCENCGMFTDTSSTHVIATIAVDGKTGDHEFVCPDCLHEKLADWGDKAVLKSFKVIDYPTFGSKSVEWTDGMNAWFLYDTSELEGSMPVFTASFSGEASAKAAQKDLGGNLVQGWDALLAKMQAADSAEAGADKDAKGNDSMGGMGSMGGSDAKGSGGGSTDTVYVCPCTGGCCDDIKSDKPGVCPRCGMTLVPKKDKK